MMTIFHHFPYFPRRSRDGAVVRALASHQCGPGSIPGLGVICGLSLLLVLVPAARVFLRVLRFSSLHKNQHFQIPIRPGNSGEKSHPVDSTEIPIYLFIYLFIYFYFPVVVCDVSAKRLHVVRETAKRAFVNLSPQGSKGQFLFKLEIKQTLPGS